MKGQQQQQRRNSIDYHNNNVVLSERLTGRHTGEQTMITHNRRRRTRRRIRQQQCQYSLMLTTITPLLFVVAIITTSIRGVDCFQFNTDFQKTNAFGGITNHHRHRHNPVNASALKMMTTKRTRNINGMFVKPTDEETPTQNDDDDRRWGTTTTSTLSSSPHQQQQQQQQKSSPPRTYLPSLMAILVSFFLCFGPIPLPDGSNNIVPSFASDLPVGVRYWTIMEERPDHVNKEDVDDNTYSTNNGGKYTSLTTYSKDEKIAANVALIDYAVGTINTQYYDNSGGAWFNPKDFYTQWKHLQRTVVANDPSSSSSSSVGAMALPPPMRDSLQHLDTRVGTVHTLKWLVETLQDPYSKYLTREELVQEREGTYDGFLGTGAYVEAPVSNRFHLYDSTTTTPTTATTTTTTTMMMGGLANAGKGIPSPATTASVMNRFGGKIGHTGINRMGTTANPVNNGSNNNNNNSGGGGSNTKWLSTTRVANLPVVTAIAPNSPAERAGLVVGDRIVAIGDRDFLGWTKMEVAKTLDNKYNADTYLGVADLTIAQPVYYTIQSTTMSGPSTLSSTSATAARTTTDAVYLRGDDNDERTAPPPTILSPAIMSRDVVVGYRSTKVHLPTKATDGRFWSLPQQKQQQQDQRITSTTTPSSSSTSSSFVTTTPRGRGEAVVQYELLTRSSGSIFDHNNNNDDDNDRVGYIRLTRFSRASTAGFIQAVHALEEAGAHSYILDLRNNYGGIIQEAMLTASTLLRDPHTVLCYTMNARGGFTPTEVGQFVVDPRYPGYLLSDEPKTVTLQQMMMTTMKYQQPQQQYPSNNRMFQQQQQWQQWQLGRSGGDAAIRAVSWDPPSSYASIHEQIVQRGIRRISDVHHDTTIQSQAERTNRRDIVILINEGTASSAEFFTAALHDNGRTVAVIGTKSYGKGLIQHTFPMPDGGGLKLTIGEFLRPSLQHVTNVLDARFDSTTGEYVGGGILPDIHCDSRQGIPNKPTADLCVGLALDVLDEVVTDTDTTTTMPTIVPGGTYNFFQGASSQMMVKQQSQDN